MHLDSISDLTLEELNIAQIIAKEQLKQQLFVDVDTKAYVMHMSNPFDVSDDSPMENAQVFDYNEKTNESAFFAPLLHSVCELVLKQGNATPFQISGTLKMTTRSMEIKNLLVENTTVSLIPEDTSELARIIIYILDQTPQLFVDNLGPACQGILAINQLMGINRRIGGTNIKVPNTTVKQLIRF